MMRKKTIVVVLSYLINLLPAIAVAQQIDNSLSYKNIATDKYFRFNYENDFFSATDEYYTQGINLELATPSLQKFFLTKLLISIGGHSRYGIALQHNGYTPSSIQHGEILYGDRPFAGCLMFTTFRTTINSVKRQRFSTALTAGVIGPAAGAAEMQTGIHRWLNNVEPYGWEYQIHNDIILNYQCDYEKQLFSRKNLSIDADAIGRIGTLSDKLAIGSTIVIGLFDSPYSTEVAKKNHFRLYAYEHPAINFVGYDATLQGGIFNHTSPYTIPASDIERIVFENRFGFVVAYKNIFLEYFQSFLSPEFTTGSYHVWGGIQIAFAL